MRMVTESITGLVFCANARAEAANAQMIVTANVVVRNMLLPTARLGLKVPLVAGQLNKIDSAIATAGAGKTEPYGASESGGIAALFTVFFTSSGIFFGYHAATDWFSGSRRVFRSRRRFA